VLLDRRQACARGALATGAWAHPERCGVGTVWSVIDPTKVFDFLSGRGEWVKHDTMYCAKRERWGASA
jgi:hypothetical protein